MLTLWRNTVYPTIAELTVEGLQTRAELPATGELDALVCQDYTLQEDLLNVNPLLDIGFTLTMMDKDRGLLLNVNMGVKIHVQRQGKRWAVDLEDLSRAMRADPQLEESHIEEIVQANAVINRDSKT